MEHSRHVQQHQLEDLLASRGPSDLLASGASAASAGGDVVHNSAASNHHDHAGMGPVTMAPAGVFDGGNYNGAEAMTGAAAAADVNDHAPSPTSAKALADKGVPPCAIKLLVSNNMAGSLIGKGGATIQNVQLQSGATVRVSTSGMYLPGTQDRVVLISGEVARVKAACALVLHTIHEQGRDRDCALPAPLDIGTERDATEVTQRLLIPATAGGLVIGRGGANIKALSEASGARVSLSQKQTSPSSERVVTIGGPLGAVRLCVDMLLDTLKREPAAARYTNLSVNYAHVLPPHQPGAPPPPPLHGSVGVYGTPAGVGGGNMDGTGVDRHQRQPRQGPPGAATSTQYFPDVLDIISPLPMPAPTHPIAAAVAGAAAITTITVSIPDNTIGAIIGRGGATINELQTASGARISVSQRGDFVPGTSNRTVTITGSPAAAQAAQYLITHRIQAACSENMQRQQQAAGGR